MRLELFGEAEQDAKQSFQLRHSFVAETAYDFAAICTPCRVDLVGLELRWLA